MEDLKEIIVGGLIVVLIGGGAFAVSQTDVLNNFTNETGMSEQKAQEFVNGLEDASFTKIGEDLVSTSEFTQKDADSLDCDNYIYEWETPSLDCYSGKSQLTTLGQNEKLLGECFIDLDKDLGAQAEPRIKECIKYVDDVNDGYSYPICLAFYDNAILEEAKNVNLYNKSVLKTALESS